MAAAAEVERIVDEGRGAFPELALDAARLVPLIRRRLDGEAPRTLAADEVYLACACALRDDRAIATFERRYFGAIAPALARMSLGTDEIHDIEQTLRVRLFVAEGDELPRVVGYAGTGQLGALVRVAAVRAALNLLRDRGRLARDDDGFEELPVTADDPALAQLKAQHRAAFKGAFEEAIAALEPRDRSLLQLAIVQNVSIDRVGAIYGVHRATAARWIAQARANLAKGVHRILGATLRLPTTELDDLLPLVESQLELSLERLLRSRTTDA